MIRTVYRFQNDMVVVFNERGRQMPKYNGRYDDVREAILADAPDNAEFYHVVWGGGGTLVDREEW